MWSRSGSVLEMILMVGFIPTVAESFKSNIKSCFNRQNFGSAKAERLLGLDNRKRNAFGKFRKRHKPGKCWLGCTLKIRHAAEHMAVLKGRTITLYVRMEINVKPANIREHL